MSAGARLACRRAVFGALWAGATALLLWLAIRVVGDAGWTLPGLLLLGCFVPNAPWLALALATGLVGALRRGLGREAPAPGDAPIRLRTAIAVCLRHEAMAPVAARLAALGASIAAAGLADRFALCLLSDSDRADCVRAEDAAARALAAGPVPVMLQRRAGRAGWKAGNVMAFLDGPGAAFDAFVGLDADSAMTLPAILRLVRTLAAEPGLAIVQPTIAADPGGTRFAALLALGHDAGVPVWASGQAWWQGDRGPYWGHNAAVRIAPFRMHCRLGTLPGGARILSHDHVEAARLHAAGWGVRVLAGVEGSAEGVPPTLPDFVARDLRWAAGNLQYRHLLLDRSLGRIGRLQMLQALLHYALTPCWFALLPLAAWAAEASPRRVALAPVLALLGLGWLSLAITRLAGHAGAMLSGGGAPRARAAAAELLASLLLDAILAAEKTHAVLRLAAGRRETWVPQAREGRAIGWREAAARFWPHMALGLALLCGFAAASTRAALLALPAVAGLLLAIPYVVLGSRPAR